MSPYLSQIDHLSNSTIFMRIGISGLGLILGSVIAGKAMSREVLEGSAKPSCVVNHYRTVKYRKVDLIAISISILSQVVMVVRWANGIRRVEVHYLSRLFLERDLRHPRITRPHRGRGWLQRCSIMDMPRHFDSTGQKTNMTGRHFQSCLESYNSAHGVRL
jgi:hypothetical protein